MRENWYVLEDGRAVDPNDVMRDTSGVLRHKSGVAVVMLIGGVANIRAVDDPVGERRKAALEKAKDIKPEEPKRGYKTRETKAG